MYCDCYSTKTHMDKFRCLDQVVLFSPLFCLSREKGLLTKIWQTTTKCISSTYWKGPGQTPYSFGSLPLGNLSTFPHIILAVDRRSSLNSMQSCDCIPEGGMQLSPVVKNTTSSSVNSSPEPSRLDWKFPQASCCFHRRQPLDQERLDDLNSLFDVDETHCAT